MNCRKTVCSSLYTFQEQQINELIQHVRPNTTYLPFSLYLRSTVVVFQQFCCCNVNSLTIEAAGNQSDFQIISEVDLVVQ